ncbi:MAG: AAA family ATPase, partial [Dysgonamonadaceae bacterium]|nr:AAA family ATPase [Dysgonamonadaceae bacterium]
METVANKLPIGIQSFETLITEGYIYADKTRYLVDLINAGRVYFFARPRRFGKSLTTTTLKAIFEGKKELFKGLYAEEFLNRPDFRPSPVIRLDMSKITTDEGLDYLRSSMIVKLKECAENLGVAIDENLSAGDYFAQLIRRTCEKYGEKVVILIDEYDKPYSDFYLDHEMAEKVRNICRSFYIQVKANEEYIRFVFLTGISKFTKLGVFSTLNNLKDISMDTRYGKMCGLTEEEILRYFPLQIEQVAKYHNFTVEEATERMRYYYNGFCFDGVHKMYNPFSTLSFLDMKEFDNYWMSSGGQKAVADYLKNRNLTVEQFRNIQVSRDFVMNP